MSTDFPIPLHTMTAIGWFLGAFWALVAALCVLVWLSVWTWHRVQWTKREAQLDDLYGALSILERWCAAEFPLTQEITGYVKRLITGEPLEDLDAFRERLRRQASCKG